MAGETKLGTAQIPIRATLDQLDRDLSGAKNRVTSALKGVGTIALGGLALGAVAAGGAIAAIGPAAIEAASDLNESMSKAQVVFGKSTAAIDEFGKTSAKAFGISKQQAYESAGTFGNLFTTMGLSQSTAADMSVDIVKLAADLASFNNLDPTLVLEKLRSGLVGETEPLRSLGVNLTADAIKAKAMEMGLAKTTTRTVIDADATEKLSIARSKHVEVLKKYGAGSLQARESALRLADAVEKAKGKVKSSTQDLTPAMKAQAAYALIMEQTKTAQGDFARTSDGLANTQRILGATWKNLLTKVGTAFLPVVLGLAQALVPIVDALMPKFESVMAKLSPIMTDVGNSIGIFVEVLTRTGDPVRALSGALENFPDLKATFDNIFGGGQTFLDVLNTLGAKFWDWLTGPDGALSKAGPMIGRVVAGLSKAFSDNWPTISATLGEWGKKFWDWLTEPGGVIDTAVTKLDELVKQFTAWAGSDAARSGMNQVGQSLGENLVTGVVAAGESGGAKDRITGLVNSLLQLLKDIIQAQMTLITSIGGSLASGFLDGVVNTIKAEGPEKVKQAVLDLLGPTFLAGIFSTQGQQNLGKLGEQFRSRLPPGLGGQAAMEAVPAGTVGPAGTALNFSPVFNGMTEENRAWYSAEARRQAELMFVRLVKETRK